MYRMHMTAQGKQIRIDHLEDDHLYNCIVMYCDQIDEQVLVVSGAYEPDNEFEAVFFKEAEPQHQRQNASLKIQEIVLRMKDYVLEASIRNLDVSEPLQMAFRRDKRTNRNISRVAKFLKKGE